MGRQIDQAITTVAQAKIVLTIARRETEIGPARRHRGMGTAPEARSPATTRGPARRVEADQEGSRILGAQGPVELAPDTTTVAGQGTGTCDTTTGVKAAESVGTTGIVGHVSITAGTICMPHHAAISGGGWTETSSSQPLRQV